MRCFSILNALFRDVRGLAFDSAFVLPASAGKPERTPFRGFHGCSGTQTRGIACQGSAILTENLVSFVISVQKRLGAPWNLVVILSCWLEGEGIEFGSRPLLFLKE
jgi:hypothetical protein